MSYAPPKLITGQYCILGTGQNINVIFIANFHSEVVLAGKMISKELLSSGYFHSAMHIVPFVLPNSCLAILYCCSIHDKMF